MAPKRVGVRSGKYVRKSRKFAPVRPYMPRIVGRGGYWSDKFRSVARGAGRALQAQGRSMFAPGTFAKAGSALGGAVGTAYGGPAGGLGGSFAGGALGRGIANVVGFGAYQVRANSLMENVPEGQTIPEFSKSGNTTRVRHREFIADITAAGSTTFTNLDFQINPGLRGTFPWLSQIANQFQEYRVNGMIFEFISTSSDTLTSGLALGSVILATDYDSVETKYTGKLQMENSQYAVSGKPSVNQTHIIECDPRQTSTPILYVRSQGIVSGRDQRLYDLGNFQIATVGLPVSSGNIGELWVSYDISLMKPIIGPDTQTDVFRLPTTIASTHYFGPDTTSIVSPTVTSTLGGYCANSSYFFPAGQVVGTLYHIQYVVSGASTTLTTALGAGLIGLSLVNLVENGTDSHSEVTAGAIADTQIYSIFVRTTSSTCQFSITAGTLPGTITSGTLIVNRVCSTVTNVAS